MVTETTHDGRTVYVCDECGYIYPEKKWAESCQTFCAENNACSIEITAHGTPPE
jgi:hypothetical protein